MLSLKSLNELKKSILLFSILCSSFTFATSSTINSQNGFGSSFSGKSTSGNLETLKKNTQKKHTQSLSVGESTGEPITENSPAPEVHSKMLFNYYKNLVFHLLNNGYLTLAMLNNSLELKDIFFEKEKAFLQNVHTLTFMQSFQKIKKEIQKNGLTEAFQYLALELLQELLKNQQMEALVKQHSNESTKEVFAPDIQSALKFKGIQNSTYFLDSQVIRLPNGDKVVTFGFDIRARKNPTSNIFYVYNITTKSMMQTIDINKKFDGESKNSNEYNSHIIVKNNKGRLIFILQTKDFKIHFFDFFTGEKLFKPIQANDIKSNSNLEYIEFSDGRKVLSVSDEVNHFFIDLDTGKLLTEKKRFSFFNWSFEYNQTKLPTKIQTFGINSMTQTKLKNGTTLALINSGTEIIFLDTSTGLELYPRIYQTEHPFIKILIQDGPEGKIASLVDDQGHFTFFELETGLYFQSEFLSTFKDHHFRTSNFIPRIIFLENGIKALVYFNDTQKMIQVLDMKTGDNIHDPISIAAHTFFDDTYLFNSDSTYFEMNNTPMVMIATNFKTFFIDLKKGELLLDLMEEHEFKSSLKNRILTHKINSFFLNIKENRLHFISLKTLEEPIPPLQFDENIKEVKVLIEPSSNQKTILVLTDSGKVYILSDPFSEVEALSH